MAALTPTTLFVPRIFTSHPLTLLSAVNSPSISQRNLSLFAAISQKKLNSDIKSRRGINLHHKSSLGLNFSSTSLSGLGRLGALVLSRRRIGVVMASSDAKEIQLQKSEEEWRAILSPEQFRILRQKGTELPGTGEYNKFYEDGLYKCAGCGTPLYKSTAKFDSGCGWPAFYEGLPGAINRSVDADGRRIEITCNACSGHLGHVFKGEGFPTPTDERHCVNSVSIKFTPANK